MKRKPYQLLWTMLAGSVLSTLGAAAPAQDYPSKPIRLIIGFPPGGSNDIVARQLAPRLSEALATQVVVENRPGANATIATELVARSAPDGHTLTLASASPLAISPHTYSKIGYDTLRDFAGITTVAMTPELVAVHPTLPVRSLKELVALAKSRPGKLNFASAGSGGLPHLAIELFKTLARVNVQHVPYKGAAPAAVDLVGGHIEGMIMDFPAIYTHVQQGKMRGLAMAAEKRMPLMPEIPTAAEQGIPGLIAVNWFSIVAPARTPRPVQEKLHAALVRVATTAEMKKNFTALGIESMTSGSPDEFMKFLQAELTRWGKVAKESGARAD
jgi:tripartite-type tricarboxylate transporter receptor subunit TctC